MNKSERLLQLLVLLRGKRRAVTADDLAQRMQVSVRTVYRDIQSLILSGVDIVGEAGVGYCLQPGSGIPPLMFTEQELEALMLGIRLVKGWGDEELGSSADSAKEKIKAVLPERTQHRHEHKKTKYIVPGNFREQHLRYSELIRQAIGNNTILEIDYSDEKGRSTQRTIKPLGMVFWAPNWTLAAWCQLREDYRLFRLDRIAQAVLTSESFETTENCSFEGYLQQYESNLSTEFW